MPQKAFIALIGLLASFCASASNYPPDYTHQNVRVLHDGPALFALASSGCTGYGRLVVGYKNRGYLAQSNGIDAVVVGSCKVLGGGFQTRQTGLRLEREMHGAGLIAGNIDPYQLLPRCEYGSEIHFEIAFSDGRGRWDSKMGNNYRFSNQDFFSSRAIEFKTGESSCDNITYKAWDFIIGEMRN